MNINWILRGASQSDDFAASPLASIRYRAAMPADSLRKLGHAVNLLNIGSLSEAPTADAMVIGKLWNNAEDPLFLEHRGLVWRAIDNAKGRGTRVVSDICDNYFRDGGAIGDYHRKLVQQSDVVTTPSQAMAAVARKHTSARVLVVNDPIASPNAEPVVFQRPGWASRLTSTVPKLKLVWYGIVSNVTAMEHWAFQILPLAKVQPFELTLVSRENALITKLVELYNKECGTRALMKFMPWTEKGQWEIVRDAHVVMIPGDTKDGWKAVKSSNRITDALNMGRYVIATALEAYQPYKDGAALVENPLEALQWYLANPKAAKQRIELGQRLARENCFIDVIGREWEAALNGQALAAPTLAEPVRLNLGCGDKVLTGYVNVDVVESRAGKKPDVLCDLRQLEPFKDASADEVMAVHVVEHFWRWEVEDILREWLRVLKPGGRMVLECPNLAAACEAFLSDPETKSTPGKEGQTTMWVFYGDPAWKDPLMVHRWGYTPSSLARLMQSVGMVNVQQEPAQYKLREPRDMRVVGWKPK